MANPLPSQSELIARFDYDPKTGVVLWRPIDAKLAWHRTWNTRFAGHPVGSGAKVRVRFEGSAFLLHRLIWKLVHGYDPVCVDHINGDQTDNRLTNLRDVSQQENNKNCRLRSDNKTGCAGVFYESDRRTWRAEIFDRGRAVWRKRFNSKDEAVAERRAMQSQFGFTERHGREAVL